MTTEPQAAAPEAKIRTFGKHKCQFCGIDFIATHNRQLRFCCSDHKVKYQDGDRIRGRQMVKLAQVWRLGRNTKDPTKRAIAAWAFQELCALTDRYNSEDVARKAPDLFETVRPMWVDNYRPSVDGKRR